MSAARTETIHCVFCKSSSTPDKEVITENGWSGKQCASCGLIYVSPRPTAGEVLDIYSDVSVDYYAVEFANVRDYRGLCARFTANIIMRHVSSGDLLEIGAAHGIFCDEFRKAGFTPFAIELNPLMAKSIEALGVPCEQRPLVDAFPGRTFDVIYHCDVTSHFYDIIGEFQTMAQRLRPGGTLVFETGNLGDVWHPLLKLVPAFHYPDHLFFLSRKSIKSLMNESGFEIVRIHRFSTLPEYFLDFVMGIRRRLSGTKNKSNTPSNAASIGPAKQVSSSFKKRFMGWVQFMCHYRIGSVMAFNRVQCTQIVVARKIT